VGNIKVNTDKWKAVYRPFTKEEKKIMAESDRFYLLEIERERRERKVALANIPRNRLLD